MQKGGSLWSGMLKQQPKPSDHCSLHGILGGFQNLVVKRVTSCRIKLEKKDNHQTSLEAWRRVGKIRASKLPGCPHGAPATDTVLGPSNSAHHDGKAWDAPAPAKWNDPLENTEVDTYWHSQNGKVHSVHCLWLTFMFLPVHYDIAGQRKPWNSASTTIDYGPPPPLPRSKHSSEDTSSSDSGASRSFSEAKRPIKLCSPSSLMDWRQVPGAWEG